MNHKDVLNRRRTIDVAVAHAIGWICWQMPNGKHCIFPPHAKINLEKSGHGHEVQGDWPADASISGCPSSGRGERTCPAWSRCVDDAMELDHEGWEWHCQEKSGFLYIRVWDTSDEAFDGPLGRVAVQLADFHTKQEAYATARCMVFLQAMAKVAGRDTQREADTPDVISVSRDGGPARKWFLSAGAHCILCGRRGIYTGIYDTGAANYCPVCRVFSWQERAEREDFSTPSFSLAEMPSFSRYLKKVMREDVHKADKHTTRLHTPLPKTVVIDSMGKPRQWDLDSDAYCVLCGSCGIYTEADFGAGDYYTGVRNVCPKCGLVFSYQDWENDEDVLRLLKEIAPQCKTAVQDTVCSGMSVYPDGQEALSDES